MKVIELEKVIEFLRGRDIPKIGELHRILTQMSFDIPENSEKKSQLDILNVYYPAPLICRYLTSVNHYSRAIVFHEWLVDLETGAPHRCVDILHWAQDMGIDPDDVIIESAGWVDFSEVFRG